MKVVEGDGPLAAWTFDMDDRIQGRERYTHVGRMCSNAVLGSPQNGVHPVESTYCIASRARRPFVATRSVVIKVVASSALHQVSARGRHVSNLPGCAK